MERSEKPDSITITPLYIINYNYVNGHSPGYNDCAYTICLVQQNPDESEVLTDVQKKELEELCETKSAEGKVLLEVRPSVRFIYLRHEIESPVIGVIKYVSFSWDCISSIYR